MILFVLSSGKSFCQPLASEYKFHTYSPEGGLNYDGIISIQQDKTGFIWILMNGNLYRYDGHQFVSYYPYFQNMDHNIRWTFEFMKTDTLGQLYVEANYRLFVYHENVNRFDCLLDSVIKHMHIDSQNHIWLELPELHLYNPETGQLTPMYCNGKPVENISTFGSDSNQLYAISTLGEIYRVNPEQGEFILCGALPSDNLYIRTVWKDKTIWASSNKNKLYRIDSKSYETLEVYDFFDIPYNYVHALYVDPLQNVWIGTHQGLYMLNPQTGDHLLFRNNRNDSFSIPDNSIYTINGDKQGNIWIGTYTGGLCYVHPNEKKHFKNFSPNEKTLNHNVISGFAEVDNQWWVATEGGGINIIDKETGLFSYIKYHPNENSLAYNNVKSMVVDSSRKNIWISMYQGGLDCYHIPTKTFTNYKNDPTNKNSLWVNDLKKIVAESDSGLWISYQCNDFLLSYFSFEKRTFEHFSIDNPDENDVADICRDMETDDLWILTYRTMYRMNVRDKSITEIPSRSMLNGRVLCLDSEHNVWIGTRGKGVIYYSINDSTYYEYNDILKFNVLTIYSMCTDRYNCLWLGTNNGLFRFDPQSGAFMLFTKDDGVHGNVFYPLASMQSLSGELFFGGTEGFTVVTQPDIRINTYKPKAILSDILIDNNSVFFDSTMRSRSNEELIFSHKESNIGFLFSSDNYATPVKNRFKYRMAGYDNRWIETDASNRFAFYTKLPAGNYTFEVLTSNNDGLWSDTPLQVFIKRLPAPWLSVWAYALYLSVIISILFMIFRYYYRQRQLKMALYKENLEKEQREAIHQSQLSFFTNISHEFKTPLSLLLAVTDTLRKDGLRESYFRILNNNAQRLLHLVNELMLFRTVESGKQRLHLEMIDINIFVRGIAEDFSDFARQHRLNYTIRTDETLPKALPVDRMILEKIVINLLNNAFHYTPDEGSISICIYSDIQAYNPSYRNSFHTGNERVVAPFYIVVHDTGIGISEPSIQKIFERFYKVDSTNDKHLGTGIGLALVKSLLVIHKGSITVYSERGKGTDMVVTLSKGKDSYEEQDFTESISLSNNIQLNIVQAGKKDMQAAKIHEPSELYLRVNKRILIVEDNEDLRKLIAGFLSPFYDIVEASNGIAATNMIRDMEIDLIISDIMMPLKDGISLCREVKNNLALSHIPFIMLTAKAGQESELEGVGAGADVYLEKPVNFDMMSLMIHNIFKRQENLREYYAKYYFIDSEEKTVNRQYNTFLKKLYDLMDANLDNPELNVDFIASELFMSKSKLYAKLKSITGKSFVEIVLNYRLKKAARLIMEKNLSISEVIMQVGIESQSYFTRMFKKEFGETPARFAANHKKEESDKKNN